MKKFIGICIVFLGAIIINANENKKAIKLRSFIDTLKTSKIDTLKTSKLDSIAITKKEENKVSVESLSNEKTTKVSWYGGKFHGRKTASGETYNMNKLSAANKNLPFGTKVKITNLANNKSVVVTINDRGPFVKSRDFDLSKAAFNEIASHDSGVLKVKYEVMN